MDSRLVGNLEIFVDTVRAGTFSTVARQRGLAVSSVARQIDTLEEALQVALLTRSTRSLQPTEAGELLFHRAVRILADLASAQSEVTSFDHEVQGMLQIRCLPTFGRRYVLPCLNELCEKYSALRFDLDLTENLIAPTVERQDVAIRFGEQPDSCLIGSKIGTQRYVMCASPTYLSRQGHPFHRDEFNGHKLIDKRHRSSALGWREVLPDHRLTSAACVLQSDDFEVQRLAALAGTGIARLPDWVVGQDIRQGLLTEIAVEGIPRELEMGIYLLRATARPSAKLKAFSDALIRYVGEPNYWLC